jgi:hypothetical protein
MKNIFFLSIVIFSTTFAQPILAQDGPVSSSKLEKEQGFNLLKIGAKLSSVRSVLLKDTIARSSSWGDSSEIYSGAIDGVYLVDLKKSGYASFLGKPIERIEVFISSAFSSTFDEKNEDPIVWRVTLYFKKTSNKDASDFFLKMMEVYGGSYPVLDMPREGDETMLWFSENVLLNALSYSGSEAAPKDDYFKIEFSSSKGG